MSKENTVCIGVELENKSFEENVTYFLNISHVSRQFNIR